MSRVDPGKRFEAKVRKSLEAKGYTKRIQDKVFTVGDRLMSKQSEGDFWFFSDTGHGFLIECKATKEKRFPFSKLREEQEGELAAFDGVAGNFHGVVAINFYAENLRERNRCIVIPIAAYLGYKATCNRASLPLEAAERIGVEYGRCKGGLWDMELGAICS